MATRDELSAALDDFVRRFRAEPRLKQMTRDWNRTIHVAADDVAGAEFTLRLEDGELSLQPGPPAGPAELAVRADLATLAAIFRGEMSPTEPYMSGRLRIAASEEDTMRLDVVTLMIWDA
ncbi:MAG: SCP2 sterol-binding domain-containing protein [Clostridia bacterium]|nr:SCP2 sterol-binding domain-containing protein [Clostridia bacterium]